MARMNGRKRRVLYKHLSERDGDFCKICTKSASERKLVIDHKDNNNANNRLDNLQLLCRSCNYHKNPRQPVATCARQESEAIRLNRTKEPEFRDYVYERILSGEERSPSELVHAGAERIGMSTSTTKRYLDKMLSNEGALQIIARVVRLKSRDTLLGFLPESEFAIIDAIKRRINAERAELASIV